MSSFKLKDKVRVIGVEYGKNSYDTIIDIIKGNNLLIVTECNK